MEIVRVFDPNTNKLLAEWINDPKDWCYGARYDLYGELCGGCPHCMQRQAEYYGYNIEIIKEEEKLKEESIWN